MAEMVTFADGLLVFETDALCEKLTQAGVRFDVSQVSAKDAGVVDSHKNNWASALAHVCNYFNQGGLGVYMRVRVRAEDLEKAKAAVAPAERKRTDGKRRLIWVVIGLAILLFLWAFAHPRSRSTAFVEDEAGEVQGK